MIRCHVFHSWSVIFRNWEYTFFSCQQSWKTADHICIQTRLQDKSLDEMGDHMFRLVSTRTDWCRKGQTKDTRSATLPSQLYLLLLIVDQVTQPKTSMRPSVHISARLKQTNKKKSKAVSEEIKKNGAEVDLNIHLLGLLLLCCWPQKCAKRWNRFTGFLLSLNTSAFCR